MPIITNYLLFNHTYLRRLQADSSVDEAAALAAQGVRDWYGFRDTSSIPSMVDSWVGPLLNSLELELRPLGSGGGRVYLLHTAWDHETPVGLCYITPPGANLDTTTKGQHWMAQAVLAARGWKPAAESGGEGEEKDGETQAPRWVILTNGNRWRLLDAQALRRYEAYLQVDLEELVRNPGDLSALRVFYRCFHRSAFERDADGRSGLDRLLDESDHATKKAEDHLKACVSANEGVMARLCLGLVQATGKDRFSEEERDAIYRDATYLLYRMLFILYAEARGLLPIDNPAYQQASLNALVETARAYELQGIPNARATTLWQRLKRLCTAIYESDPQLGIPAYNGGLFDDADKPHLRQGAIADGHLTQALFDLAYQPDGDEEDGYRRIDYRDLSVRHLGSIYEGMIEYKLQIAEETLWARRDGKGNLRFLRTGQDGAPRRNDAEIKKGDVYFAQSRGERRATGTYYTPEYIVDYIVRQTVGRGLGERRAALEAKVAGWRQEVAAALDADERARLERTADEELQRFVEEQVLTFRVCDPAMGSGHFLVNAAQQMTASIVETLHLTPWENPALDSDPTAWRRRVVEHCLYGVDLSLMAVELAKLSLWLVSVAKGKPLSFLKHHLRQGNSLIGARLADLAEVLQGTAPARPSRKERKARAAGQLTMLDHPAFRQRVTAATDLLAQISARVAETVEDIKAQEADYEGVRDELAPYRLVADLWTACHFGLEMDDRVAKAICKYLANNAAGAVPAYERLIEKSQALVDKWTIFHWEIEFPVPMLLGEGFDVVLGNPPYDELSEDELGRPIDEKNYLESVSAYAPALTYRINLYRLFILRALQLTRENGRHGFIVPMSVLGDRFALEVRRELLKDASFESIEAFPQKDDPENRVFHDAKLSTCLYSVSKSPPNGTFHVRTHPGKYLVENSPAYVTSSAEITEFDPDNLSIPTVSAKEWHLALRLSRSAELHRLGEVADALPGELMINKKFRKYLSQEPSEDEIVRGSHIGRYCFQVPKQGETLFLKRELYLAHHRNSPKARHHRQPRVVYQRYAAIDNYRRLIATHLPTGKFCSHTTGYIANSEYDPLFILSLLNSRVLDWRFTITSTNNNINGYEVEALPVPRVDFFSELLARKNLLMDLQEAYAIYLRTGDSEGLFGTVDLPVTAENRSVAGQSDAPFSLPAHVHDFLAFLAREMITLSEHRQGLEIEIDPLRFVKRDTPCLPLGKALGGPLGAGEVVRTAADPAVVHHDIEALRLGQEEDGRWLLEVRAKLRDPESGWRQHQRDRDGRFIRQWLPVYRLPLDEATGRFYHYAFENLSGFDGAGRFPGGYTRTTLQKLEATKIPRFVPVDLAPLVALEAELAEVQRKIRLTDDLIDQIVYRLYGLTEEEIAIVEGRT